MCNRWLPYYRTAFGSQSLLPFSDACSAVQCVAGTDSQGVMRDDWLIPCSMSDSGAVEMDLMQARPY